MPLHDLRVVCLKLMQVLTREAPTAATFPAQREGAPAQV